jgi:cellulose synthase/poly-beta-1,6-N-acetylglucosamine synthase-like glycosyltransferase
MRLKNQMQTKKIANMDLSEFNGLPFVSVIIPAYNEEKNISNAIEAVLRQHYPKNKIEIIVVDDSTDKTCEIVSRYPVKLIHRDKRLGPSAARNIGAKEAIGEILAFTDADDKADKEWLINIVKHYKKKEVKCVVGSSHRTCRNWQQRIIVELFKSMGSDDITKNIHNSKGRIEINKNIGPNITFRRDIFGEIKGYDENLLGGEEKDITWRIEKAGYKIIFERNAVVYTSPRDNFKKFIEQAYSRGRGGVILYFKYPTKITLRYLFNILYLPLIIAMPLLGVLFNIRLFIHLAMLVLVLPIVYYLFGILKRWRYIKKRMDMFFIFVVGYITLIAASVGILIGCFDYIVQKIKKR